MAKKDHIPKKTWQKPELQVLCRGESAENVLIVCKVWKVEGGPEGNHHCRSWGGGQCHDSSNS